MLIINIIKYNQIVNYIKKILKCVPIVMRARRQIAHSDGGVKSPCV